MRSSAPFRLAEAIGWWSNEPKDFLHTLRTAVVAAQRRFMPNR